MPRSVEKSPAMYPKIVADKARLLGTSQGSSQGSFESMQGSFDSMQGSFDSIQGSFESMQGSFEGTSQGSFTGLF